MGSIARGTTTTPTTTTMKTRGPLLRFVRSDVRAVAMVVAALVAAGCTQLASDGTGAANDGIPPVPFDPPTVDHDHADPALHGRNWNMVAVGHLPLADLLGPGEVARMADVQVHGQLAVAVLNGGSGGFVTIDLSDPADPRVLGRYASGTPDDWYARFTPDGERVALTANLCTRPDCPGSTSAAPGIHVVDVSDPTAPERVASWAGAGRVIDVETARIDGRTILFASDNTASSADVVTGPGLLPSPEATVNGIAVLELTGSGPTTRLEPVARFVPNPPPTPTGRVIVHDLAFAEHPVTGQPLLYASFWDAGAFIIDVSDPANPTELSRWRHDPFTEPYRLHTIKPDTGLVGGRHLSLTAPETFGGSPSGNLVVLDTTDPTRPQELAEWSLPGDLTNTEALIWSPHEFALRDGTAYTSHFHGGVWVLDLRPAVAGGSPQPTAYVEPVPPAGAPTVDAAVRWTPDAETVTLGTGHVLVSDMGTGLHVYTHVDRTP